MLGGTPRSFKILGGAVLLSVFAIMLWLVSGSGSIAQGVGPGDAAKGKAAWQSGPLNFVCGSCHGANGEGAYGPDLAGRTLTTDQWIRQIRKPFGLMPAFLPSTISDDTIADVAAFMASLPTVASPGLPRAATSPGDAIGKRLAIDKGCAQCHGVTMGSPRAGIGEHGLTRSDVVNQIRTAFFAPKFEGHSGNMPTFTEKQISDDDANRIADYLFALGPRVRLNVTEKATREGDVVTYNIAVASASQPGGLDAASIFVAGSVPAGATFLRASATPPNSFSRGFEAAGTPAQAAVWLTDRIPPGATFTYSYQVQVGPGVPTAAHAFLHWLSPSEDTVQTRDINP